MVVMKWTSIMIEETVAARNSNDESKQENEVYVNITVSGDVGSLTGLLLPVTSSGQETLAQLPYQVSVSESNLSTDAVLILEKNIKSENDVAVDGNNSGQSVCHYELSNNSVIETCRRADSVNARQEFVGENIHGIKDFMTHVVQDNTDVGRTIWHSDNKQFFHNQEACRNESTDILYSLSCESANCNIKSNDANVQETDMQNGKRCVKKKDYEKLAPFKFFCTLCSFKSKRESHYQRHLELHSKVSELFSCKKCDFTTIRLGHLRRHEMSHSDTKFVCDMCHYHTDHHKFLLRHQRIKHASIQGQENIAQKELLRCVECAYSTTRPYFYKRHLQAHTGANSSLLRDEHRFHCQQCSYKTGRKVHYIRHVNNVHNNKRPYLCDHCGKAFKRPDALKQHRVTHVELDPNLGAFRCPVCGKCCRAQAQLTQHLAVHSNVRSFLCEICGSSFKTRAVQRKHVLTIHKNPKAFSCSQCSRKFNTKYALRRHMKQHSLDKKRKPSGSTDERAVEFLPNRTLSLQTEPEENLNVLQSEPVLIQEAPRTHMHDSQTAITVQVIGFMPYSDTN
ncbi:PR domain zinc finger protein 5-like isoform X2 [Zootermopsis nevadensis]|uniref:PR domain zinc finger protein 5-like isoform X2 n=1 Tax=Zootermopsis nevadensis TaxID=136037 RepID=UPI000B8E5662|nr:PR domain zinc finger protein 5-like isoform X2 [Zootermopsis nevadensis]